MSHETGLYSARRPREILGNIQYNSAIPQPASAIKRSSSASNLRDSQIPQTISHVRSISSSRMSIAPGKPPQPSFTRSSSSNNLAGDLARSAAAARTSSFNVNGASSVSASRSSLAPSAITPAKHRQSSISGHSMQQQRRSSIYSRPPSLGPAGHQSFFVQAPAPATAPRDPRPWRDHNFRARIGQELLEYLTRNNFELEMKQQLSQKSIAQPTQKCFEAMFQWLYHRIDPAYKFFKNIDVEGPFVLKQLYYPYVNACSKSQWQAVGGQNWSTFLGMLHWMMQLGHMIDKYDIGEYDDACAEAGIDVSGDRIIFRFLSGAYREWLQVEDDGDEEEDDADKMMEAHVRRMAEEFEAGNARYVEELRMLEAESAALQQQIKEAEESAPDLAKLEKHFRILEDDKRKFEDYNHSIEGKCERHDSKNKFLLEELQNSESQLQTARGEKAQLQAGIDQLGIAIQDIDRMNSERERLQKGMESMMMKLDETKQKAQQREVDTNRAFEDLERSIDKYNSLCYQVALIPVSAANAQGEEYELRLKIDVAAPTFSASQLGSSHDGSTAMGLARDERLLLNAVTGFSPAQILNLDLRGTIRSHLVAIHKEINRRRTQAMDADMRNHELLDSIKEAIDDKRGEVEALEHRVRGAEEEWEKTKEVTATQKSASDAQIEKMEKELAKMRANLEESFQLMEQKEMNTNIEFEQLTIRANSLREELHSEVEKMLGNVVNFKIHIQTSLEDYENFVAREVEQELDEGETRTLQDEIEIEQEEQDC